MFHRCGAPSWCVAFLFHPPPFSQPIFER
jgi:hypothetical protein